MNATTTIKKKKKKKTTILVSFQPQRVKLFCSNKRQQAKVGRKNNNNKNLLIIDSICIRSESSNHLLPGDCCFVNIRSTTTLNSNADVCSRDDNDNSSCSEEKQVATSSSATMIGVAQKLLRLLPPEEEEQEESSSSISLSLLTLLEKGTWINNNAATTTPRFLIRAEELIERNRKGIRIVECVEFLHIFSSFNDDDTNNENDIFNNHRFIAGDDDDDDDDAFRGIIDNDDDDDDDDNSSLLLPSQTAKNEEEVLLPEDDDEINHNYCLKNEKSERHIIFAHWLVKTYGIELLSKGSGVLDVAGGNGEMSRILYKFWKIPSTLLDPNPRCYDCSNSSRSRSRSRNREDFKGSSSTSTSTTAATTTTTSSLTFGVLPYPLNGDGSDLTNRDDEVGDTIRRVSFICGMHPDQATEPIVSLALRLGVSFAILPCCVMPSLFPYRIQKRHGDPVRSYKTFCQYLLDMEPPPPLPPDDDDDDDDDDADGTTMTTTIRFHVDHLPFVGRNKVIYSTTTTTAQ